MSGWGTGWDTPKRDKDNPEWVKTNPIDKPDAREYLQEPIIEEAGPVTDEMWNNLKPSSELAKAEHDAMLYGEGWIKVTEEGVKHIGVDLAKPESDVAIYTVYDKDGGLQYLTEEEFQNKFKNISPTHDPYTNPNAHIYYECSCGAILDPGTKSFAALNNCASEAGWKVRWGADSYVPYCVKCGENVE